MTDPSSGIGAVAVAAAPIDIVLGDVDGNLGRIRDEGARLFRSGARVVVLPELATSGYVFASAEEARAASIAAADPRLSALSDLVPHDAALVLGFAELDAARIYSSAAVITATGIAEVYRKTHLWGDESLFFSPGDAMPPVVDTPAGRIGVAICYDAEFPEVPRSLALRGADLIAAPVNWPLVDRPAGERPPEIVLAMAAARASHVPMLIADRTGSERGVDWTDGSALVGADGWIVSGVGGVVRGSVDLEETRDKRIGERNDVFRDRRPELY